MKKEDLVYSLIGTISRNCPKVPIELNSMFYESRRHLVDSFHIKNALNFQFKIDIFEGNNSLKIQLSCDGFDQIYFEKVFKKDEGFSFDEWEDLFSILNKIAQSPKYMEYWLTEDESQISYFRWRIRNLFYKIINIWQ